jgi:hypothetical protein
MKNAYIRATEGMHNKNVLILFHDCRSTQCSEIFDFLCPQPIEEDGLRQLCLTAPFGNALYSPVSHDEWSEYHLERIKGHPKHTKTLAMLLGLLFFHSNTVNSHVGQDAQPLIFD